MGITKYKVINPVVNKKMPFFDKKKGIFFIPLFSKYNFYVECIVPDGEGGQDHFLLLGIEKFDANCRICHTDCYGRVQVKLQKGPMLDFILSELEDRANINVEYTETVENYNVYTIT